MASFKDALNTIKDRKAAANPDSKFAKIRGIEHEAKRRALADDGKAGRTEMFNLRNQLRAEQGLGAEKRKRGGLAGFYDDNKGTLKTLATGGAGLLTGGLALPALIGAGIGGLDREGKGGVGFDVGGAVKGGLQGAVAGGGGKLLGSAAMGMAGASGAGLNPLWGAMEGVKTSGIGKAVGSAVNAGKGLLKGAVTNPDGSLDGKGILKGALGALPLLQGMKAQREANERSSATAGQADASNDAILELAKMLMMRSSGAGGGGKPDLSFLRDRQNPYAGQFQPSLAPPRM